MATKKKPSAVETFKFLYTQAFRKAEKINETLLSTDKRLRGSVLAMHRDGSLFLWDSAFVLLWKYKPKGWPHDLGTDTPEYEQEFALIFTEHHRTLIYPMEDLKHLRAMGPRTHIKTIKS